MVEELSFFKVTNRQARLINQLPEEQFVGESTQRITQDQLATRSLRELERSGAIQVNSVIAVVLKYIITADAAATFVTDTIDVANKTVVFNRDFGIYMDTVEAIRYSEAHNYRLRAYSRIHMDNITILSVKNGLVNEIVVLCAVEVRS